MRCASKKEGLVQPHSSFRVRSIEVPVSVLQAPSHTQSRLTAEIASRHRGRRRLRGHRLQRSIGFKRAAMSRKPRSSLRGHAYLDRDQLIAWKSRTELKREVI